MAGIEVVRKVHKLGLHGRDVCHIRLTDVRVPVENRLGDEGFVGFIPRSRLLCSFSTGLKDVLLINNSVLSASSSVGVC